MAKFLVVIEVSKIVEAEDLDAACDAVSKDFSDLAGRNIALEGSFEWEVTDDSTEWTECI